MSTDDKVKELKKNLTRLLSFNLWGGGIIPISEPYSHWCFFFNINGEDEEDISDNHPIDCICFRREYVVVGAFHIVKARPASIIPACDLGMSSTKELLVASFHAVHSIGSQFAVASSSSSPITPFDVHLTVAWTETLQRSGVLQGIGHNGPWLTENTYNLVLLLFFFLKAGYPSDIFGKQLLQTLQERMKDRMRWKALETDCTVSDAIVLDYTEGIGDEDDISSTVLLHNRSKRGKFSCLQCDVCSRWVYLGYVKQDNPGTIMALLCFRCRYLKLNSTKKCTESA